MIKSTDSSEQNNNSYNYDNSKALKDTHMWQWKKIHTKNPQYSSYTNFFYIDIVINK